MSHPPFKPPPADLISHCFHVINTRRRREDGARDRARAPRNYARIHSRKCIQERRAPLRAVVTQSVKFYSNRRTTREEDEGGGGGRERARRVAARGIMGQNQIARYV